MAMKNFRLKLVNLRILMTGNNKVKVRINVNGNDVISIDREEE